MTSGAHTPAVSIRGGDPARHHIGDPSPGCPDPNGTPVLRQTRVDPCWGCRSRNPIRVTPVRFDALRKSSQDYLKSSYKGESAVSASCLALAGLATLREIFFFQAVDNAS